MTMPEFFLEKEHRPTGSVPYIELVNRNLTFLSHYHEEVELVYVEEGAISAFISSNEIQLRSGDLCLFMPGEIHSFHTAVSSNLYVIKIGIHSDLEGVDFSKIRLEENKISPEDAQYALLKPVVDALCEEYRQRAPGYEFAIRAWKNRLIMIILRYLPYRTLDTSQNNQLLNDMNRYLESHSTQKIRLEEMAEACHFSKYYFAHKVKELTGMTFGEYVAAFRLEKAVQLLRDPDQKVTEIAYRCGFGNLRSFHRNFIAAFGVPPTEYRKR